MGKRFVLNYQGEQPERLDKVLARELPQFSRRELRRLILQGSVYVNRKRVRKQSFQISAGKPVRIIVYPFDGSTFDALAAKIDWHSRVLYRDEHLLALNKPAGIPTAPVLESAVHNVYAYAQQAGVLPHHYYSFHRLDKGTTGVLLIPLRKKMAAALNQLTKTGEFQKRYWLIGKGNPPGDEWEVEGYLSSPVGNPRKVKFSGTPVSRYRRCLTRFRVLAVNKTQHLALIEAQPVTGRTHQIRISMEVSGLTILGDPVYGNAAYGDAKTPMLLHCLEISFRYPVVKEHLTIRAKVGSTNDTNRHEVVKEHLTIRAPLPDAFLSRLQSSFPDIGREGGKD